MILTCIKNFFKSLGFYFIPLGVMAFMTIISLAYMVPEAVNIVKGAFEQIAASLGGVTLDWDNVQGIIYNRLTNMMNNDPSALMHLMTNVDAMVQFLKEVAQEAFGLETISNEITTIIQNAVTQLTGLLAGLLVVVILSFFIGFMFLNVTLRKYLTECTFIKAILTSLLDGVVVTVIVLALMSLLNNSMVLTWIIGVIFLLVMTVLSLLEAYLFYAKKKIPFKELFNIQNLVTLLVGDLIDIALTVGLVALCLLINNAFVKVFVAIPFVLLAISILGLNADTYAAMLVKEGKILKREELKAKEQ